MHSKYADQDEDQDDNTMNTLGFINILLVKFSKPLFVKIFHHQNFALSSISLSVLAMSLQYFLPECWISRGICNCT